MAERIFVDTNPIIYFLNTDSPFYAAVRRFFVSAKLAEAEFYTSTITDAEFLVKPLRNGRIDEINAYRDFTTGFGFFKLPVTEPIAARSAELRTKYRSIKLADSLQLASGIVFGCDKFLTNDAQLKQVTETDVVYLGDV